MLLRARLLGISALFAIGSIAALSANLLQALLLPLWAPGLALAIFGCAAAVIHFKPDLSLHVVRGLELAVFGTAALLLSAHASISLGQALQHGSAAVLASLPLREALIFSFLVVIYGIFIPNTIGRAAAVTFPLAGLMPTAFFFTFLTEVPSRELDPFFNTSLTESLAFLSGAAVISVGAATLISMYQRSAIDARDLGLYSLKKRIGQGGIGEVWPAEHQMLARPAAIKIVRPEILKEEAGDSDDRVERTLKRFEREAQATASLRSPHTVELYDFGRTAAGVFYYVMEFLDGLDLDTLVEQHGPTSPERTVFLLQQACESLGDAHSHGLIHRDVKPANLYACRMGLADDFLKVLDFGLVKDQREPEGSLKLTIQEATTGTPAFMPPEMAVGSEDIDARSDIYSLGCVAYWMLTGQTVFDQTNPVAMAIDHVKTEPDPPSIRTEIEVPAELDEIILKSLAKRPEDRYQTAIEFKDALEGCPLPSQWSQKRASEWWRIHAGNGNGNFS